MEIETQAKAQKLRFEPNLLNCKTTQKQVYGTKWGRVGPPY